MNYWKFLVTFLTISLFIACSSDDDSTTDDGNGDPGSVDRSQNLLTTGASAADLLGNENFDDLMVEIAYVDGFRPTDDTLEGFASFLREHSHKENINLSFRVLESPNEDDLNIEKVAELENENRTAFNDGRTLAIYIYFADAPSEGDMEDEGLVTLGAVYRNTSMVIYESTIRRLASLSNIASLTELETATLNHEFGHLFGLVNLGTVPVNPDHEDSEAMNHCNVDGCLMRAQLEFQPSTSRELLGATASNETFTTCNLNGFEMLGMIEANLQSGAAAAVPVLQFECEADLESNGGRQ